MKFLLVMLILIVISLDKSYTLSLKSVEKNNIFIYNIDNDFKLAEGPIYSRGWVRFSNFEKESSVKPKEFIKNAAFSEQFRTNSIVDLKAEDNIGLLNIPAEDFHYAILTDNSLNLVSSRDRASAKTIEIINLEEIIPLASTTDFKGGIVNHGDFKEGYCFQILTRNKQNKEIVWELCANTKKTKVEIMNSLVKLVQRKGNITNKNDKANNIETEKINYMMQNLRKGISKETLEKIKKAKEPTWIAITPWSECSKSCGGGKSYLQRICIVPKNSKEHCEGDRIIMKECNLQPCDEIQQLVNLGANQTKALNNTLKNSANKSREITADNKPVNSMLPITKKGIKYEKCIKKEGDLALFINDGSMKGTKIPVRVLMNNSTLTVYSSDTYESIIVSHRLSAISGLRDFSNENTQNCFEVEEKTKKTILCAFNSNEDNKNLQKLAQEWKKDILEFIKNCADYHSHELDFQDANRANNENIKNTLDFYRSRESEETEKIIMRTQQLALQALEKELKVENLIEKEEEEREKLLAEEFEKKYEKVKSQKERIVQALEQKKKQADIYANKQVVKKKIIQISEAVKRQVEKIREDLKSRLLAKKKDEARKRELIRSKIENLKKDISKDLIRASKKGDDEECDPERPKKQIINYCTVNYESDSFKLAECVKDDNFCYMCCEAEYGELHLELRNNCYTKCNDFYFFKINFKHTKVLNTYLDIKRKNIEIPKKEDIQLKNRENNLKSDKNYNQSKKLDDIEVMKSKFLERNSKITELEDSKLRDAEKGLGKLEQSKISQMIEEQKKKEILMKIKEDLNFD